MKNYTYEKNLSLNINPDFITGLTDSEGSFSISTHKDTRAKFKRNVGLRFKITNIVNKWTYFT